MSGFNKSTQTKDRAPEGDFYGNVSIDNIPSATNSAKFFVSGSQNNFDSLDFYLNGDKVDSLSGLDTQSFSKQIGDLKKGENKLYITAKTKDGKHTKETDTVKIFYKGDKPKLEVSDPKDGVTTNNSDVVLKGNTDQNILVKVNDFPVVVSGQGSFQTSLRIKDGENKIVVTAQDDAGNIEKKEITVTYHKDN